MDELKIIEYNRQRVVTSKQIAEMYQCELKNISYNFNHNKDRYKEGKHYYRLVGNERKEFLQSLNSRLQNENKVRTIYLWTERGALLLAKSINTDIAWGAYERLVDFYFQKRDESQNYRMIEGKSSVPAPLSDNWYKQNRPRLKALCKKFDIKTKTLLSQLLHRLDMTYDTEACKHIYEKEKGYPPTYATDIIGYFPELEQRADELLRIIEEK